MSENPPARGPGIPQEQPNNPLHGKTLEAVLRFLVDRHGWEYLGARLRLRCFQVDPSINSSLKFLRRNPWARERVEETYLDTQWKDSRRRTR